MNLLEVGRIDKPHGVRGDVVVALTTTEKYRVAAGSTLYGGDRELRITASRPHQHRWIVTFEGVYGREGAEEISGLVLLAERLEGDDDPEALWVHELIGSAVVEPDGTNRGVVMAVQDNPASDLLVLDTGALVPLRFVEGRDEEGRIVVDVPDGLFELLDED
ncbi:MAG: ribosome maturation factor RimM [Acidimicrobiales bacterium]